MHDELYRITPLSTYDDAFAFKINVSPLFAKWMLPHLLFSFIKALSVDEQYASSLSLEWIQKETTSIPEFIKGVNHHFTETAPYTFINISPKIIEILIRANLIMMISPKKDLLKHNIPLEVLKAYGHSNKSNEVTPSFYFSNSLYHQHSYITAWLRNPDHAKGFNAMCLMRIQTFLSQHRMKSYDSSIKDLLSAPTCFLCSAPGSNSNHSFPAEDAIHMIDVCPCWSNERQECLQKLKALIPSCPLTHITQLFMGSASKKPALIVSSPTTSLNKSRFNDVILNYNSWIGTPGPYAVLQSIDEHGL